MDNQHKLISGYGDLSQDDIELMNKIKAHGAATQALLLEVMAAGAEPR